MIEITKEGKLPKNIRQIGQVSGNQKVYIEDYVITYLKQIPAAEEPMRIIILYGKKEMLGDELCWFVNGAVGAEKDFFMEKTVIDQESWQRVNEMAGRFFPELGVLGWAIVGNEPTKEIEEQILRTQKQFFRQDQKLYFEYNTEEKEEYIYLYEKGKMRQQTGYYIYYERNECMQNYMVSLRAAERHPEEFHADKATHQFREIAGEKKQEIHRRKSAALMTCVSLVLMMVIMVIGITMLNNYEKMQSMEQVLYQISGKIDQENRTEADISNDTEVQAPEEANDILSAETMAQAEEIQSAEQLYVSEDITLPEDTVLPEDTTLPEEENQVEETQITEEENQVEETQITEEESRVEEIQITEDTSLAEEVQLEEEEAAPASVQQTSYIIQKGDTLAKICMKYYGNYSNIDKICEMNGIKNKDNILYGQKIFLP